MRDGVVQIDFWNVGQGDCSTVLRPDGSLDVIDVGPVDTPQLCDFLRSHPHVVNALVLTHNDEDHVGALPTLLEIPGVAIRNAFLIDDGHDISENLGRLLRFVHKDCIYRIERRDVEQVIDMFNGYELKVKHPTFIDNMAARRPNRTSAIISLERDGQDVVVWASDNMISTVRDKVGGGIPMLFGPHHGSPEDVKRKRFPSNLSFLKPAQCFLSFGHKNSHNHPNAKYLAALRQIGCHVVCSQRCRQCKTGSRRFAFNGDARYGLKPPRNSVPCHGHVRLFVDGVRIVDELDKEYRKAKQEIRARLC